MHIYNAKWSGQIYDRALSSLNVRLWRLKFWTDMAGNIFLFSSSSSLTKFSTIVIVMTITTAAKIHQKTSSLTSCWILLSWQFISCVTRAPLLLLRSWVALSVSQSVCEGSVTPDQIFNKSRSPFSIENAKLWPVFADCGYFVTNLRTFLGPFYRPR